MALARGSIYLLAVSASLGAGVLAVVGLLAGRLSSFRSASRTWARRIVAPSPPRDNESPLRALFRDENEDEGGAIEPPLRPWEQGLAYDPLSIAPGELPGYTGWARPEHTLAGRFRILSVSPPSGTVAAGGVRLAPVRDSRGGGGRGRVVRPGPMLRAECRHGGSHFYLRAYGPAILAGRMVDEGDGTYAATFYPVDPGVYTVEAVLAFSTAPLFDRFPLVGEEEPGYEGYLLPGFPLRLDVVVAGAATAADGGIVPSAAARSPGADDDAWCTSAQLVETEGSGTALRSGRWKVVDRVQSGDHGTLSSDPDGVSWTGYRENLNSLGVVLRYVPNGCRLLPESRLMSSPSPPKGDGGGEGGGGEHLWDKCLVDAGIANSTDPADQIHIIMIGDSVMRLQEDSLRVFLNGSTTANLQISRIGMTGGISRTLANVSAALEDIHDANPAGRRFVVFNSALHDMDRLCSSEMRGSRKKHFPGMNESALVCVQFYRELLGRFVDLIAEYPAELKIFRTANAAWPKYGNYGFTWPTTQLQPFSRSPNFVAKINDVAYGVVAERGKDRVRIVDGYWMTLPRPDHTEVGRVNTIGKHMVHPGVHVSSAMTMKVFMLVLRQLCSRTVDDW
eukprot:CAMPEP_0113595954 /NCGR_PEP_ID=MMETSP0015_2-20120614/40045_1 /TAXON_ID=2838 /ORGANISM="Odontella" /LENGTH=619 /DNA_ID=CAMNT_0000503371 /DNA_START=733 /DNA_END=2591 /DNA_ORIENTATION=- /assembly_acc=CAM_ASM_000160